jgi:hypothetical protein
MKRFETILLKLVIIQLIFLLIFQLYVQGGNVFLEQKRLAQYEGVTKDGFEKALEVLGSYTK